MTILATITPTEQDHDVCVFENEPLIPFYKRNQMEKAKYLEWLIDNVNADPQVNAREQGHPQTGEMVQMYPLNHLVRVAGQYENLHVARTAVNDEIKRGLKNKVRHEADSEARLFGISLDSTTVTDNKGQRWITILDFFEQIFSRLRPNQQARYLPCIARECALVFGNAVQIGCKRVEAISESARDRRQSLSEDFKGTMNLMEDRITEDINTESWLRNLETPKETKAGYVYMVTSPILNAVKIGHWGGCIDKLRARYVTSYGANLTLITTWVEDRKEAEATLHERFSDRCITNELFEKEHMWYYLANWMV